MESPTLPAATNLDTRRFIIDTDVGSDDIQALFMAIKHLNVIGICAIAGNVEVDKVVINIARILQACDKKIPIYR